MDKDKIKKAIMDSKNETIMLSLFGIRCMIYAIMEHIGMDINKTMQEITQKTIGFGKQMANLEDDSNIDYLISVVHDIMKKEKEDENDKCVN